MWAERQQVTEARAVKQMEQPDAVSPAEAKPDAKALLEIAGANAAAHLPMLLRPQTCREAVFLCGIHFVQHLPFGKPSHL